MDYEEMKSALQNAAHSYYNNAESIISDEEFDKLKDKFRRLYPKDPFLKKIGAKVKHTEWKKARHNIRMCSLDKCNTEGEFLAWTGTVNDEFYILGDKADGLSIDLDYPNGKLTRAITRGDGVEGEDILDNVLRMKNVKKEIPGFSGSLRGEIVMLVDDFDKVNEMLRSQGEKELANPRNGACGKSRELKGTFCPYLTILYYDVTGKWKTEEDKLLWLKKQNLRTVFWVKINAKQCVTYYGEFEKHLRTETPYDIDGLVIKANSIAIQDRLGESSEGNPRGQIAWKFAAANVETEVEGIEWSLGLSRRVTPVALLKPVRIGGVTVKRASLHNLEMFRALNLGKNDVVLVSRRNDVIPYVEKVVKEKSSIKFKVPLSCPTCGEELEEDNKYLICSNDCCRGLRLGNLEKWVKALNVMDISEKTIESLEKNDIVKEPSDFYTMTVEQLMSMDRMGEKSAKKIIDNFRKNMEIPLATFVDGLNISNFGESRAELLIENGIDTLDKMMSVQASELIKIKGLEMKSTEYIISGIRKKAPTIKNLLSVGIKIKQTVKEEVSLMSNALTGKSFCFTGGINRVDDSGKRFTREMMQELVMKNGGSVMDSVKKGLSYLVQADPSSQSTKTKKAHDLGVDILSEADFFKMLKM